MASIRDRFEEVWSLNLAKQYRESLTLLEAMRPEVLASDDASHRSTYFQTLAGVLDHLGDLDQAMVAARTALAIDLELWPEGKGTFLSLHSLLLILERLDHQEEANVRARELLAIGEKAGGVWFATAVNSALKYVPPELHLELLERARFQCKVALAESPPEGSELHRLVEVFARVVIALANVYMRADRMGDAETLLHGMTRLLVPFTDSPRLRSLLAATWGRWQSSLNSSSRLECSGCFCATAWR